MTTLRGLAGAMEPRVTVVVVALVVGLARPAHGQYPHLLAEAIAAGVEEYADGSLPPLLCIRLVDAGGQDMEVPENLPRILRQRLLPTRGMTTPEAKTLEDCGSFRDNVGDLLPASFAALLVTARAGSRAEPRSIRVDVAGPGGARSFACSLPEETRAWGELQSECRAREGERHDVGPARTGGAPSLGEDGSAGRDPPRSSDSLPLEAPRR